uniref:Zinc finger, CCHC-type n=1 Tax=Tanacetum cinerariifolium TaxID=118510 RepID=A0A699H3P7_TANCI|nr:zinc finger, CCHC-type [Tanacetum cinerariifolium]
MAAAMKHMASNFAKLEKFKGVDFRSWQKKMHFFLSSMSVVYVLTTLMPEDGGENPTMEQVRRRAKWDNDDYVWRGLILNVLEQYNELLGILRRFIQHKINMDESIQVSCIIDKIPPSWKDFKHTLKHLKEELTLIELGSHLRIEESLKTMTILRGGLTLEQLCHVHFKRMQDISKDELIPAFDMDTEKCNTYMLTKITKKPFQNVKREVKVLELIHSDLCDLHATPSLGNKKYFVTFIDDAGFCYVYLLRTKDEALDKFKVFKTKVELQKGSLIKRFKTDRGVAINSIIELRDFIFDEHRFSSVSRPSQRSLKDGTKNSGGQWSLKESLRRPLGCKWIFKRKLKVDGIVEKFKTRLVIQGFKQKSGIDYFDTYAPVARIKEEVYMNQPLGFILPGNKNKVCKLIKSLYRLKHAPKQWHQKFNEVVLSNGYLLNQTDKCVYSKIDGSGKGFIICLYVDDMLIFGTDQVQVDLTKEFLSSRFSMKDMREADVILGIRIKHESNGITIFQSHYIENVMKKFYYSDCTLVSTPLDTCDKLMPNKGPIVSQLEYSRVISCLMYVMTCTRPDIAFAVGKLSKYTSNPGTQHWQAIQRVLKFLKKTIDYRLVNSGYPSVLKGYTC